MQFRGLAVPIVTKSLNSRLKTSHELRGSLINHYANSGFGYISE